MIYADYLPNLSDEIQQNILAKSDLVVTYYIQSDKENISLEMSN